MRYSKAQALKNIKKNLRSGETVPTSHFKERMAQRKVSMQDVIYILKKGAIFIEPELDIKINQWKYKVEGKTIDGEPLAIVIGLEAQRNTLITCMRG